MLNARVNRRPLTRLARLATAAAIAAITVPIAVVAQNQFSTVRGTIVDQTNRPVPGVAVSLTNTATQAKNEVRSDRTGQFEIVGLPPGDYTLAAEQAGFKTYKDTIGIVGGDVTRRISMAVGDLHETISVRLNPPVVDEATRERNRAASRATADRRRQKIETQCGSGTPPSEVGGNIAPPLKLVDVRPVYPEPLKAAKIGGVLTFDALIGTDGTVREVKASGSPNPDLEKAAADAIRQWQFTPTYLNCTPIEVTMQVSVTFDPTE